MFTTTQQKTITNTVTYLAPEVRIQGQSPERFAIISFPSIDENGKEMSTINITINKEDFNTFYENWESDAYLFTYLPDTDVPVNLEGDVLNEIVVEDKNL